MNNHNIHGFIQPDEPSEHHIKWLQAQREQMYQPRKTDPQNDVPICGVGSSAGFDIAMCLAGLAGLCMMLGFAAGSVSIVFHLWAKP